MIDRFQNRCIELLSKKAKIKNFISCLKFKNNYEYLGIGSEKELELALNDYYSWKRHREDLLEEQMRIFSDSTVTKPPFDCLLQLNKNQSTYPTNNKIKFDKLFNSAINSYKFITCHYDKNKIRKFRQKVYGKDNENEREIFSNDDVTDLFVTFTSLRTQFLRNFIIKIDDKDSINFENLTTAIDEFLKKCFSDSAKARIYYKPRKFIYTTIQIYSTLPEYFKRNYKLINVPDTNNEEDIIERIRIVISERHEKRFENIEVDWQKSINQEISISNMQENEEQQSINPSNASNVNADYVTPIPKLPSPIKPEPTQIKK